MPDFSIEMQEVRMAISRMTGANFEITTMEDHQPSSSTKPVWYLACLEITEARLIPYVNAVWREGSRIVLESISIGNTSDWIESEYGEKGVISILNRDLSSFGNSEFRDRLLKPFPYTKRRINLQESVIRGVAKEDRVNLEVRYVGGEGLATFYLDAIVDAAKGDVKAELKDIEKSLKSMKKAWRQASAL